MNDYKELVEYLRKMHNVMLHNDNVESGVPEENITDVDAIACKEAADAIEQLVKERDAAVVHGHWIEQSDGWVGVYYDCSACGNSWTTIDGTPFENGMNYCPNCGAKMDEVSE